MHQCYVSRSTPHGKAVPTGGVPIGPIPAAVVTPVIRWWHGRSRYLPHPDPNQEAHFYALLAELVDAGKVSASDIAREIAAQHIRADSAALIDRYRGWTLPSSAIAAAA